MLYLKESQLPNAGKGLFTDSFIKKGERIIEYKGEIVTWAECEKRAQEDKDGYVFYINSRHCIDAWPRPEALARYANDARGISRVKGLNNNAEYVIRGKKVFIEAVKNIKAGSEIFVSYGADYWKVIRENIKKGFTKAPGS